MARYILQEKYSSNLEVQVFLATLMAIEDEIYKVIHE